MAAASQTRRPSGVRTPSLTPTITVFFCASSSEMRTSSAASSSGASGSSTMSGLASAEAAASQPASRPMISTNVTLLRS